MSDKELVEKFMFYMPTTVVGTSFSPIIIKSVQKEVRSLRTQLAKANERVALLEQCVIKFRQGVTHFNRTRGDLNVLLSAYADCEQLRKEQE